MTKLLIVWNVFYIRAVGDEEFEGTFSSEEKAERYVKDHEPPGCTHYKIFMTVVDSGESGEND